MKSKLLISDAMIDLLIGLALVIFPVKIIEFFGLPMFENPFYVIMLGSMLVGIAVALLIDCFTPELQGLGLFGAIIINLCVSIVLLICLATGILNIALKAKIGVILLIIILIGLSCLEYFTPRKGKSEENTNKEVKNSSI